MSIADHGHLEPFPPVPQIAHRYGPRVHLLADAVARSQLARLSEPGCRQPALNRMVRGCYLALVHAAIQDLFPTSDVPVRSRMAEHTPAGAYHARLVDRETPVAIAAVARAGTLPAYDLMAELTDVMNPDRVRIDHLFMNRRTDAEGKVVAVDFHGSKIGGDVDGAILLVPDPMAATGGSMLKTLEHYRDAVPGRPRAVALLHLIVTPEYLRAVRPAFPDAHVYALRLDRGLSDPDVLDTVPGTFPDRERGLNDVQYIVPGAGGLGEVMNNAFV